MPTVRPLLLATLILLCGVFRATAQLPADSLLNALSGHQAPMEKLSTLRELSRASGITEEGLLHFAERTVAFADTVLALPGIDRSKVLSMKAAGIFNVTYSTYANQDPPMKDSLLAGYRRAEALWRESGDRERIGFVTYRITGLLEGMGRNKEAYDMAMNAMAEAEERSDTTGMVTALMKAAQVEKQVGDHAGALDHTMRAYALAHVGASQQLSSVEMSIALSYAFAKELDSAMTYLTRIFEREDPRRDLQMWSLAAVNIMVTHREAGRPERAVAFWEGLPAEVRSDSLNGDAAFLHYGIAYALQGLGRYKDALREASFAMRVYERCGCGNEHRTQTRLIVGEALLELGEPKKALAVARTAWEECEQNAFSLHVEKETAGLMERVHEALGTAPEALRFTRLVKAYTDSMKYVDLRKELSLVEWRKQQVADSLRVTEEKRLMQEEAEARVAAQRNRKLLAFGGGVGVLVLAFVLWRRLGRTRQEKARSEAILHNVLPEEVARELRETGTAQSRAFEQVTILFTDFQDFTELSATLTQQQLMAEIEACFTAFDGICQRHGVEKIKTIGDAYMAAAGLKGDERQAAVSTVQSALDMQAFIEARHAERSARGLPAFRMRVGIHTGPVVAGIVGVKKFQYDIWGDTVNTASRMESSGEVGQVNISEATYALVKNEPGLTFTPRGKVQAKGKGEMEMFFVRRSSEGA